MRMLQVRIHAFGSKSRLGEKACSSDNLGNADAADPRSPRVITRHRYQVIGVISRHLIHTGDRTTVRKLGTGALGAGGS